MMLHNDRQLFEQLILRTSEHLGIKAEIVEKDYYVTIFLKQLVTVMPDIIFKGGTSLSKCYKLIKRFSEDIDLNIQSISKPSESQRKNMKSNIINVIDYFDFTLTNPEKVKSRREYNRYVIDYPSVLGASYLKEMLIVETVIYQRSYPTKKMQAGSFIYDYLADNGFIDFAAEYDLTPFELNVQAAERTLIDKIYALADYYLAGTTAEHSRHIYDIYKLCSVVSINDELKELSVQVANERKPHKRCLSVQDGVIIKEILLEIIRKEAFREDYENITSLLLFETVSYDEAINGLSRIISSGLFD